MEIQNAKTQNQKYKQGFGGIMGWTSSMAVKKLGKAAGVIVGAFFISIQAASHAGYIDVKVFIIYLAELFITDFS